MQIYHPLKTAGVVAMRAALGSHCRIRERVSLMQHVTVRHAAAIPAGLIVTNAWMYPVGTSPACPAS